MDSNTPTTASHGERDETSGQAGEDLLTREELRDRLKLKTVYAVDHLVRSRKIPVIRIGRKTTRFYWPEVKAALAKLTKREAGVKLRT